MIIRLVAVLLRNSGVMMISANYVLIDSLGKKSLKRICLDYDGLWEWLRRTVLLALTNVEWPT